jgi:hypothetical protein
MRLEFNIRCRVNNESLSFQFPCKIIRSLWDFPNSESNSAIHTKRMNFPDVAVRILCTGQTWCSRYF